MIRSRFSRSSLRFSLAMVGIACVPAAVGCATTQQVKISGQNYCPFLGSELCSMMTPSDAPSRFSGAAITGNEKVAGLRYINPNAQWTSYKKVLIAPVTFWAGGETKVSPKDQHMLTDYFTQALQEQLSKKFEVVQAPEPGAMTVTVAIIDASTAVPVLRTISMLVPQARGLATLKYLATGTYAFVGSAEAEAKVMDSVTHQVLAAAVDKRVGGGSLKTAAQWQWGDAENSLTAFAQQMSERLADWTSGKAPM